MYVLIGMLPSSPSRYYLFTFIVRDFHEQSLLLSVVTTWNRIDKNMKRRGRKGVSL